MNIILSIDHGQDLVGAVAVDELAQFVLTHEELPENTEVSISFVDNDTIAALNEQYRGKTGPTDVLSFECDGLDDDMLLVEDDKFEQPTIELGDIVIAPDVALHQTTEFGTTIEEELSLLIVHGLLHLCGYDHIVEEEAQEMEALEKEILSAWVER
jgi:probable rRNA maturation factor